MKSFKDQLNSILPTDQRSANRYLCFSVGSFSLYLLLIHKISGPVGGFFYLIIGWVLPLIFVLSICIFLTKSFSIKFKTTNEIAFISLIVLLIGSSYVIDSKVNQLSSVSSNEGCMCFYFEGAPATKESESSIMQGTAMREIDNLSFFQHATESFLKGFQILPIDLH